MNKICIFHCGNIDIFNEILNTYPQIYDMKLLVSYYNDAYFDELKKNTQLKILKLQKLPNKGMDIGAFIFFINFLLQNNHLYNSETLFFKLHTKSITNWRNHLIKDIITYDSININEVCMFGSNMYIYNANKQVNSYCRDLVFKYYPSIDIETYFDTYHTNFINENKKINIFQDLIPSDKFYNEYENLPISHWYNYGHKEFHRKSNVNYVRTWATKEINFIAGTIFGFNMKWLQLFRKYDLDYEYSLLENDYLINDKSTVVHAWEYFFGIIASLHGKIIGCTNGNITNTYLPIAKKHRMLYSDINQPYNKARIAIFMLIPDDLACSGGYRTLLNFIRLLNDNNYVVDLYFGIAWNEAETDMNVSNLNEYGVPQCNNWLKTDYNIDTIIRNIKKYNVLDISMNNYYIGLKCQRKYNILIANAWQITHAIHRNIDFADKICYIIQDREELFYTKQYLKDRVISTYKPTFHYFCVTKYLENYFRNVYKFKSVVGSRLSVNTQVYFDFQKHRNNSVVIPYYGNIKVGRLPRLVEKIITILSQNNICCYVFPQKFHSTNKNVINLGSLTEKQLSSLYNKNKVGIIFSNTNPSRLGFEMYASGLHVIEYDSEFTKYDMSSTNFTKIKSEKNILSKVQQLFSLKKSVNNQFINDLKKNKNDIIFLNYIKENL